jgi:hypothetical protein
MVALLSACDPHAESAGSDNSTESGTAGSASDEGTTPDVMGRKTGEKPSETTAPSHARLDFKKAFTAQSIRRLHLVSRRPREQESPRPFGYRDVA